MYKKQTQFYGIPYISNGEKLEEGEEEKAAKIIDNMIFASTLGVDKAIYEDGNYRLNLEEDGVYTLSIIPYDGFSFLGIVNYHLFVSRDVKYIRGLTSGQMYFIYVFFNEELSVDSERFSLIASPYQLEDNTSLSIHVATVDLTGIEPKIDEEPYDRKYTTNIIAHIKDTSNPHGRIMYQDILQVEEELYLDGRQIFPYEIIDLELKQNNFKYEFNFDKKISFVSYCDLSEPQKIWFNIKNNKLTVNSEGKYGLIKLRIEFK